MATQVRTVTVNNSSNQVITFNYQTIDALLSVTSVPALKSGTMNVPPLTQVVIEESRIDRGQLLNIETLVPSVKVTEGLVST